MLGEVKVQMLRGDILNGGTDVIVNTTDFSHSSGIVYLYLLLNKKCENRTTRVSFIFCLN